MSHMTRDETIILLQCIMYCSKRMHPKQLKCNILASTVSFSHMCFCFISVSNHDGRIQRMTGELIIDLKNEAQTKLFNACTFNYKEH